MNGKFNLIQSAYEFGDKKTLNINNKGIIYATLYYSGSKQINTLFITNIFTNVWHIADTNGNKSRRVLGNFMLTWLYQLFQVSR